MTIPAIFPMSKSEIHLVRSSGGAFCQKEEARSFGLRRSVGLNSAILC